MHQADTRKIADRPHILTSIGVWMALLMSAGSLWFAYSGFKLAEVANAASMQVEEISLRAPWRWNEWSASSRATIPLKLKVRNFGKLTAQNLLVEVFPNIIVTRRPLVMSLGSTRATGFVSDNMPPGAASLPFEMDIPIDELRGHEAVAPSDVAGIMISPIRYESMAELALVNSLKHVEPAQAINDVKIVESFIDLVLSHLKPAARKTVIAFMMTENPGWREDKRRPGILFPAEIIHSVMGREGEKGR